MSDVGGAMDFVSHKYSTDFKVLLISLLSKPITNVQHSINDICSQVSVRMTEELDKSLK